MLTIKPQKAASASLYCIFVPPLLLTRMSELDPSNVSGDHANWSPALKLARDLLIDIRLHYLEELNATLATLSLYAGSADLANGVTIGDFKRDITSLGVLAKEFLSGFSS